MRREGEFDIQSLYFSRLFVGKGAVQTNDGYRQTTN